MDRDSAPATARFSVEKPVITAAQLKRAEKLVEQINSAPERIESAVKKISDYTNEAMRQFGIAGRELAAALSSINAPNQTTSLPQQSAHDSHPLRTSHPAQLANVRASAGAQPRSQSSSTSVLPVGEARILTAIAQHTQGVTREQLTILTGYKRSSRDAYIQRLSQRTYVTVFSDHIEATDEGVAALGSDFEPLPTGKALRDYWVQRLPGGERVLFEALLDAHPQTVNRDDLSDATGYKRSSRDAYLQRLTARKLIVAVGRGEVKASDSLYT